MISFAVEGEYRHWRLDVTPPVATVTMVVDPAGGLGDGYELKLNSYDLGVDIELHDIVQRLRFEHPGVKAVVLTGGVDKVFCSGANIQMLATSTHGHKVNFCKFTNETRNSIEDATTHSGQTWIAAINGTAAGGGYELALACEHITLVDDRASAVSLPEIPLLAVLPGTGGLTRVVDKRHVRRDLADVFTTKTEGAKGHQALAWGLVDEVVPRTTFDESISKVAAKLAAESDRPDDQAGVALTPLSRSDAVDHIEYSHVSVQIDRALGTASIIVRAPTSKQPSTGKQLLAAGAEAWVIAAARELDDAALHLRFNETSIGTWVLLTEGSADAVVKAESLIGSDPDHWLVREARLLWTRTLKRLELSARTLVAQIEPGSCFTGTLAELALVADRTLMVEGAWEGSDLAPPILQLTAANQGWYPMSNGITRLETRFWGQPEALAFALDRIEQPLVAQQAVEAQLVTFAFDDLDWEDEIRLMHEERNSFSPDALTAMEANYRFVGPETMETKIFARLTAWQNWIFQRPNAVGPQGALRTFGTGTRPSFDRERI